MQISELSPKSWSFREDRIYLCHCVRHSQVLSITFVSFSSSLLLALSQGRISFKTSKTSFCLFILSRSLAFALLRRYLLKRAFFDSRSFIDLFGSFLFTSVSRRFFTDVFLNDLDLSGMAGFDSAMVTYQAQLGGSGRRRTERARTHVHTYEDTHTVQRSIVERARFVASGLASCFPGFDPWHPVQPGLDGLCQLAWEGRGLSLDRLVIAGGKVSVSQPLLLACATPGTVHRTTHCYMQGAFYGGFDVQKRRR